MNITKMMPDICHDYSLQNCHSFGLKAKTRRWVTVHSENELRDALVSQRQQRGPLLFLGEGSNTVFTHDFPGTIIHLALRGIQWHEDDAHFHYVEVAAGENWHDFVEYTLSQGKPGLENLALIPGSVGACPIQNIGAYGLEVSQRIHEVRILDLEIFAFRSLSKEECRFAYRDSVFKHHLAGKAVVTAVVFKLPKVWAPVTQYADIQKYFVEHAIAAPTPRAVFNAVVSIRTQKLPDPCITGNAGSFFKNPIVDQTDFEQIKMKWPEVVSYPQPDGRVKLAAAWLIEQAGLKGQAVGGAAVSEKQALVLINQGGATADDLNSLVAQVVEKVRLQFAVNLEPEPLLL